MKWPLVMLAFIWPLLIFCHQRWFDTPTAVSRLDALHCIVRHGTIRIDQYHTNTPDKALFEGHYYSDKAPGTLLVALPAFSASIWLLRVCGADLNSRDSWLRASWITCASTLAPAAACGAIALLALLRRFACYRAATLTAVTLVLGAAPLPYSTMLFSHSLVSALISIALWLIVLDRHRPILGSLEGSQVARNVEGMVRARMQWRRYFLAGLAAGLALASEYTAGLVVAGILVYAASADKRACYPMVLGMVIPMLLVPLYSYLCFRDPFILPYSLQASFPAMREGLYAIKWPSAETAANLLMSPARGFFFWTPFLFMAIVGISDLLRMPKRVWVLCLIIPLIHVVVMSGRSWDWVAGPSFGPRYLAPVLPLLAIPCALGLQRYFILGCALACLSILLTTVGTLTDATPPPFLSNPLLQLHVPALRRGELSPNLLTACGLPASISVGVYLAWLAGGTVWMLQCKWCERASATWSNRLD